MPPPCRICNRRTPRFGSSEFAVPTDRAVTGPEPSTLLALRGGRPSPKRRRKREGGSFEPPFGVKSRNVPSYCLSYTAVLFIAVIFGSAAIDVTVRDLPSAETEILPEPTTAPPFFRDMFMLWSSTFV